MTRKSMSWMCAALVVTGIGLFAANSASAGWGRGYGYQVNQYGHQGFIKSGYGYQNYGFQRPRGYAQPHYDTYSNFRGYGNRPSYDAVHFGYQPPTITRHGNHLDRTSGHFDIGQVGSYYHH